MQLFAVLADVGLFTIVVREISRHPDQTERLVGNTLTLRLVLSAAAITLAALLSLLLPYEPDVRVAILLAGLPLLFGMLNSTFVTVLQARLRMGRAVVGDVVGRAVSLAAVGLVVAWTSASRRDGHSCGRGAGDGARDDAAHAPPGPRCGPGASPPVWRRLLVMALPLGVALAVNEIYFRADTLIISLYEPYEQVGLYTLAYRMLELTLVFGTVFLTTTFPLLSQAVARDEPRARRTIELSTELFVALGVPLVAGGLVARAGAGGAGGRQRLRGRGDSAAHPARRRRAGVDERGVRLCPDRKGPPAQRALAQRDGLVFNVALNLALVPSLRHSGRRRRDRCARRS